jgi:hypothetical protein
MGGIGTIAPSGLLYVSNTTSGGYYTNAFGQLKIQAGNFWRVSHLSTNATISGVYNFQTGIDVYWGVNADTGAYRFRGRRLIVEDGNVGIGTVTPIQKLDVAGVVRASGGFMFADGTVMTTAATSATTSTASTSSNTDLMLAADADATGDGSILLQTAGMERVRVANVGNVGIGTTTPTSPLHINQN